MSTEQNTTKQAERARFEGSPCAVFMKEIMAQGKGWDCARMMAEMMELCRAASSERTTTDQKETP